MHDAAPQPGDTINELNAALAGRYVLERELGGGGMSRVYFGREPAFDRRIVLKSLSAELSGGLSAERFAREVQLAARLQHPHIVPLLAAGNANGVAWYAMPYVEGETLRARLSRGALPLDESISILRDVARALEYAHTQGVVHRDIKPENVLLAGQTATVTDFGIAKAVGAAHGDGATAAGLTRTGTALGTPAYMAPEQVAADAAMDQRVDVYAWGCLAYELLTGNAPFHGRSPREVLMAHMHTAAPSLGDQRGVPPAIASLIARCLEKDPDRRPASATELLASLSALTTRGGRGAVGGLPTGRRRMVIGAVALGVAVVAVGFLGLQRRGSRPANAPPALTIAVLPMANVGGDSTQDYFSDGMTDELATALGRVPSLHVAARSGTYRFKGRRDLDAREVGRSLGVNYLLQGTVRRAGPRLRLSAQLTNAADGVELWSESYERDASDVFGVQDDLASAIVAALRSRLSAAGAGAAATVAGAAGGATAAQGTADAEAYDDYLRGMYYLNRRRQGLEGADRWFARAIARDPKFARAHAEYGFSLAMLAIFGDTPQGPRNAPALAAAQRAIELDSTLADAWVARGIAFMAMRRFADADAALHRAVVVNPASALAHFHRGRFLFYIGQLQDALPEFRIAQSLEPYSAIYASWVSSALATDHQFRAARREAERAWQLDSMALPVLGNLAELYALSGDLDGLRRVRRVLAPGPFMMGLLAWTATRAGDSITARAIRDTIVRRHEGRWLDHVNLGYAYLALGDTAQALGAFDRSAASDEPIGTFDPLLFPVFDAVRGSARFLTLVRRIGLPDAAVIPTRTPTPEPQR